MTKSWMVIDDANFGILLISLSINDVNNDTCQILSDCGTYSLIYFISFWGLDLNSLENGTQNTKISVDLERDISQ